MSISNPESAQDALNELKKQTGVGGQRITVDDVEAAEAQAVVESTETVDTVLVTVAGETVEMDKLGMGQRLRPLRRLQRAEQEGDDMAALDAILDMLDTLVDASPPEFDQAWWDDLDEDQIRDVFHQFAEGSAGGPDAGK